MNALVGDLRRWRWAGCVCVSGGGGGGGSDFLWKTFLVSY